MTRKAPTTAMGKQREFLRRYAEEHPEAKPEYDVCPTCKGLVSKGQLSAHQYMQHERRAVDRMEHSK